MAENTALNLTPVKLAGFLRDIANKLDKAGDFELLYDDQWYWEFAPGGARKLDTERPDCEFTTASASDAGDYFADGFDASLNEMLGIDLWKLSDLLRYYDLTLGSKVSKNGS